MPLGYKYDKRDTDSYVDWSVVGKNLSIALATEAEDRRDRIQAFEDQNVKDVDFLNRAPQGKYKTANEFTNSFAHDAKEQNLIYKRLLESGQISPRQFTLNRQNMMNGTNQIFDLQKTFQAEYDKRMAGVQSGDLQALNIANMAFVQQFGDFTKSKGIINPLDGTVNIGMIQLNPKTGVMELTKDVMPVSVAMGKITTEIKAFDINSAINKSIESFGDRKEAIYNAANIVKAGTITELTGIGALEKYKAFAGTITKFNEAVDGTIASYFSNSYHLSSVLTENTGKYDYTSYTFDKDEADNDSSKLLLKIDLSTGIGVLDESAKNYPTQKKEAEAWVRTQIMNRLDSERKISTTSQLNQLRPPPVKDSGDETKESKAVNMGKMLAYLLTGNAAQKQEAADYFRSVEGLTGINPNTTGINVKRKDGSSLDFNYDNANVRSTPDDMGRSIIKELNKEGLNEDIIIRNMKANLLSNQIDPSITAESQTNAAPTAKVYNPITAFNTFVAKIPDKMEETDNQTKQADFIRRSVGEIEGVTVKGTGTFGDYVTVYYDRDGKNEKRIEVSTNEEGRKTAMANIKVFLKGLPAKEKTRISMPDEQVGSQY